MLSDKLLTVKELAEIVGVTTQNIYHHMKNNIKSYVVKTDDGNKIKASVITEHYKMVLPNDLQNINDDLPNENKGLQNDSPQKEGDLQNNIKTLQNDLPKVQTDFANETNDLQNEMIQFLKEQIEQKDSLLKDYQAELKIEREHSRQQADRIADLAEQIADLTKNQQVLFGREQQKSLPIMSSSNDDISGSEPVENSEDNKKGFFKKIFGKNK